MNWLSLRPELLPSWWRSAVMIATAIVVIVIAVPLVQTASNPDKQQSDFGVYYRAGQIVAQQRSPYTSEIGRYPYAYAPVFAYVAFQPLAKLPYVVAMQCFLLLNVLAVCLLIYFCLRMVRESAGLPLDGLLVVVLALVSTGIYLRYSLYSGQTGVMLALACVFWFFCGRTNRHFLGGLVLSVAIAMKIYPALLIPFMLLRGDVRGLAGCAVGLVVLFLAPAIWVGLPDILTLHTDWIAYNLQRQDGWQTIRYSNQSLLSVLARLPFVSDGYQVYSDANLEALYRIYPLIAVVAAMAVYAYIWIDQRRWRDTGLEQPRALAHVSVLFIVMTLATPRAWPFNFAIELLPAMMIAAALLDGAKPRWLPPAALLAIFAAICVPSPGPQAEWRLWAFVIQSKHFFAALFLAYAILVTWPLRREQAEATGLTRHRA